MFKKQEPAMLEFIFGKTFFGLHVFAEDCIVHCRS